MIFLNSTTISIFSNSDKIAVHIIGWLAGSLSIIAFLPQSIKVIKTRKTKGISLMMYVIYILANIFWILWASIDAIWVNDNILISDLTVIVPNTICTLVTLIIVVIKIHNIKMSHDTLDAFAWLQRWKNKKRKVLSSKE